jgi:hypothetical protein
MSSFLRVDSKLRKSRLDSYRPYICAQSNSVSVLCTSIKTNMKYSVIEITEQKGLESVLYFVPKHHNNFCQGLQETISIRQTEKN